MSPPPLWGYLMTSTAAKLAIFTTDYVEPDAILMMFLDSVQEVPSPALYAEIALRLAVRGCPRDVTLLWSWCAAAGGDVLSQRRIARELLAEAASPDPRISPEVAANLSGEWTALAGRRPWRDMSPPALQGFPEPRYKAAPVLPSMRDFI